MADTDPAAKVEGFAAMLVRGGLARPDDLQGCDSDEIARLEARYGVRLPAAYRAYLARVGHGAGGFRRGSDFLYADLFKLRETADDVLAENGVPFALGPGDFVFMGHHDYQLWWLPTADGGEDPPVYFWSEVDGRPPIFAPIRLADAFSAWLFRTTHHDAVLHARNRWMAEHSPAAGGWRRRPAGRELPDR